MIYTVTCNPAVDYVVHTDELTKGMVNRARAEHIYFGGKGINVSAVLRELGAASTALGFVAGFTGAAIEQGVRDMGIETDFIHLDKGFSRINVKMKAAEETELNGQGPEVSPEALRELLTRLDRLRDGDVLILAGSIPGSLPRDLYEQILRRLTDKDLKTAVDTSGEALRRVLPYKPFLIKPNHHELGELFGRELKTTEEIAEAAGALQQEGARNVLVSMAEKGALLLDENGILHTSAACQGTVRNSVGAGDSMLAGFLAGTMQGDYDHALRLGTACGGAAAFSDGLPQRALIDSLLSGLEV